MPLYDYKCPSCRGRSTRRSCVVKRDEQICSRCGGELHRQFSVCGTIIIPPYMQSSHPGHRSEPTNEVSAKSWRKRDVERARDL